MPDFRDAVYQLDKKLADDYGDRIDALVVMANMTGVIVKALVLTENTYLNVNFNSDNITLFELIIVPRFESFGVVLHGTNSTNIKVFDKIATMEELLATAENMIVQGDLEKLFVRDI